MKLKCTDGVVRHFEPCRKEENFQRGVHHESTEAFCKHCGHLFGHHDTWVLRPRFMAHCCPQGKAGEFIDGQPVVVKVEPKFKKIKVELVGEPYEEDLYEPEP